MRKEAKSSYVHAIYGDHRSGDDFNNFYIGRQSAVAEGTVPQEFVWCEWTQETVRSFHPSLLIIDSLSQWNDAIDVFSFSPGNPFGLKSDDASLYFLAGDITYLSREKAKFNSIEEFAECLLHAHFRSVYGPWADDLNRKNGTRPELFGVAGNKLREAVLATKTFDARSLFSPVQTTSDSHVLVLGSGHYQPQCVDMWYDEVAREKTLRFAIEDIAELVKKVEEKTATKLSDRTLDEIAKVVTDHYAGAALWRADQPPSEFTPEGVKDSIVLVERYTSPSIAEIVAEVFAGLAA